MMNVLMNSKTSACFFVNSDSAMVIPRFVSIIVAHKLIPYSDLTYSFTVLYLSAYQTATGQDMSIITIEDFDCGLLGTHELTVHYRYDKPCTDSVHIGDQEVGKVSGATVEVFSVKARVNYTSPASEGVEIGGLFSDMYEDKLHNQIIDLHNGV